MSRRRDATRDEEIAHEEPDPAHGEDGRHRGRQPRGPPVIRAPGKAFTSFVCIGTTLSFCMFGVLVALLYGGYIAYNRAIDFTSSSHLSGLVHEVLSDPRTKSGIVALVPAEEMKTRFTLMVWDLLEGLGGGPRNVNGHVMSDNTIYSLEANKVLSKPTLTPAVNNNGGLSGGLPEAPSTPSAAEIAAAAAATTVAPPFSREERALVCESIKDVHTPASLLLKRKFHCNT